jgi:hypothetical protein
LKRYYIGFEAEGFLVDDPHGVLIESDRIRHEAGQSALRLLTAGEAMGEGRSGWQIRIADEDGNVILRMPVWDAAVEP